MSDLPEHNEIAEDLLQIVRQYLKTYENPDIYSNVTRERQNLRYSMKQNIKEYDAKKKL